MKFSKLSMIAVAVAAAVGSTAAFAVAPTVTPDFTLYTGGGSAQTNAVMVAAGKILTNIDSYTENGTANSGSYRVLYGTTSAAFTFNGVTIPGGKNVLFFYKFNGGSFPNGAQPQVTTPATQLTYPTVASVQSATAIAGASYPNPTFKYTAVLTNNELPDWGVTDEEVGLFNFPDNVPSGTPLTPAQLASISHVGIYDNLYGVAVSNALFAVKSSFTKAEVNGILSGQFIDWSQIRGDNGNALAGGPIVLLDRGVGSGSKAAGSQYFLTYPGALATGGAVTPGSVNFGYTGTTATYPATSYEDINESSSGTLVTDLNAADVANTRAIGILGLEFPPALNLSGGTQHYSFAKINGVGVDTGTASDNINGAVATSYINVVTGAYDFFYQNSFNTRGSFLTQPTNNAAFANQFITVMKQPTFVGANSGSGFPTSTPGALIDADVTTSIAPGVTTGTRNKASTAPLQPVYDATTAIPTSHDPL